MASWDSPAHQPEKLNLKLLQKRRVKEVAAARERQRQAIDPKIAQDIGEVATSAEAEAHLDGQTE